MNRLALAPSSEYGQVSCGLSLFNGFLAVRRDCQGALQPWVATINLTRLPRIQVFCLGNIHHTASWLPNSYAPKRYGEGARLDSTRHCTAWDYGIFTGHITCPFIPVVTFLAPLASNFEGLKDR